MRTEIVTVVVHRLVLAGVLAAAMACAPDSPGTQDVEKDVAAAPISAAAPAAESPAPQIDVPTLPAELVAQFPGSHLTFAGTQAGAPFDGQFKRFLATALIDDTNMARSFISAQIQTVSADTNNAERDETLLGTDFFNAKRWPLAAFRSSTVSVVPTGYLARGPLTIRDQTHPVNVNFVYTPATAAQPARLRGSVAISRLKFNVGGGEWADTQAIGDTVQVKIDLLLR